MFKIVFFFFHFSNLHNNFFPRTGVLFLLLLRVMRIARPFLVVTLYLTAFAGYCFNYVSVCRSFFCAFCCCFFSDSNVLIAYCVYVRDMQGTYDQSFVYGKHISTISIYLWSRSVYWNNLSFSSRSETLI